MEGTTGVSEKRTKKEAPEAPSVIHITATELSAVRAGMKLEEILSAIPALERACVAKQDAAVAFSDLCEDVAKLAGVKAKLISAGVTAMVNDKLVEKRREAEQLHIICQGLS